MAAMVLALVSIGLGGVIVYKVSEDAIKVDAQATVKELAADVDSVRGPGEAASRELVDRLTRLKVRKFGAAWVMDRNGFLIAHMDPRFQDAAEAQAVHRRLRRQPQRRGAADPAAGGEERRPQGRAPRLDGQIFRRVRHLHLPRRDGDHRVQGAEGQGMVRRDRPTDEHGVQRARPDLPGHPHDLHRHLLPRLRVHLVRAPVHHRSLLPGTGGYQPAPGTDEPGARNVPQAARKGGEQPRPGCTTSPSRCNTPASSSPTSPWCLASPRRGSTSTGSSSSCPTSRTRCSGARRRWGTFSSPRRRSTYRSAPREAAWRAYSSSAGRSSATDRARSPRKTGSRRRTTGSARCVPGPTPSSRSSRRRR